MTRIARSLAALLLAATAVQGAPPAPVSPGHVEAFAAVESPCPTFSWTAVESATGYELVVYAAEATKTGPEGRELDPAAAPAVRQRISGQALAWSPSSPACLQLGGAYAWAVRALFGPETGEWSQAALFEVSSAPLLERIGGAVERALGRYLAERGVALEPDGSLAAMLADELVAAEALSGAPPPSPADERTVFFGGEEIPVSQMEAIVAQRLPAPRDPPGTAYDYDSELNVGAAGGTGAAVFTDDAELVLDDEFDSAAAGAILVFRSENTFDWGWKANSAEAGGALFLLGSAFGDSVSFPATGGANFNDAFVLNEFQLDPKTSGSRPSCNSAADEGLLYYDSTDGLCHCDGSSWKKVDGNAAC